MKIFIFFLELVIQFNLNFVFVFLYVRNVSDFGVVIGDINFGIDGGIMQGVIVVIE